MTKSELIAKLAERLAQHNTQLIYKDAELLVKTILDAMANSLAQKQRIEIRGFGSFDLNYRPPRLGRNPKSGTRVLVPEKYVPHFKAGKSLRERVDLSLSVSVAETTVARLPTKQVTESVVDGHSQKTEYIASSKQT